MYKEGDVVEHFCGACFGAPLMLVGAGVASKSGDYKKDRDRKKLMFWGGITLTIVSAIVTIYYLDAL